MREKERERESCATLAVWGISRERIGQLFSECCLFSFFMYLSNTFVCWNCVWTFVLLGFYERRNVNVSLWKISFLHTLKRQWTRNKDLKSETYTIPFFFFFFWQFLNECFRKSINLCIRFYVFTNRSKIFQITYHVIYISISRGNSGDSS